MRFKSVTRWVATAALVAGLGSPSIARAEGWDCNLGFYMTLFGLEGTIGYADQGDQPVDASIDDLAGLVDFFGGLYFEARQPKYILQTDLSFYNLGDTRPVEIDGAVLDVELNLEHYVAEVGGAYRVTPEFSVWLAGRFYTVRGNQTFQGSDLSSDSHTWADAYVGARYMTDFAEKWVAVARADVGAGGSDMAWYANAEIGYRFTPGFTLAASYRLLSLDYVDEGDTYFKYDVTEGGLGIVADFRL